MTKKQKKMLSRILISAVLFLLLYTVPAQGVVRLLLYLIPYAVIGWDVLWRAVKNIRNGQVFDENFLMSIATIGAFGCGEYPEACLLYTSPPAPRCGPSERSAWITTGRTTRPGLSSRTCSTANWSWHSPSAVSYTHLYRAFKIREGSSYHK